jgi:hypothetical protein
MHSVAIRGGQQKICQGESRAEEIEASLQDIGIAG